jgi:transposase
VGGYPFEIRERAVWLGREHQHEYSPPGKAIESMLKNLGIKQETSQIRIRRTGADAGERPGLTTDERHRMNAL